MSNGYKKSTEEERSPTCLARAEFFFGALCLVFGACAWYARIARVSIKNQAHAPSSPMTTSGQKWTFEIIFKINILAILNISSRTWYRHIISMRTWRAYFLTNTYKYKTFKSSISLDNTKMKVYNIFIYYKIRLED